MEVVVATKQVKTFWKQVEYLNEGTYFGDGFFHSGGVIVNKERIRVGLYAFLNIIWGECARSIFPHHQYIPFFWEILVYKLWMLRFFLNQVTLFFNYFFFITALFCWYNLHIGLLVEAPICKDIILAGKFCDASITSFFLPLFLNLSSLFYGYQLC